MKKIIAVLLAAILAIASLAACGGSAAPAESAPAEGGEAAAPAEGGGEFAGQTLYVANWKGYGSDADYGAKAFEAKYGCKVEHQYFTSLEEMVTMLKQGGLGKIDVCLPNSSYVKVLVDDDLVQPIDTSKVSTFGKLREDLRDFSDSMVDGKYYALPWTWGTTSLGYNPTAFDGPITSWDALWDPANKGKVAMFDEAESAIIVAAIHAGDPDPFNPDLEGVKKELLNLKENVRTFWASYDEYLKPYMSGEITIGNMWAGTASQLLAEGEPVDYVYPEEGTVAWADYWAICKDAPNYDLAVKWVEFMTDYDFQYAFATGENAHNSVNADVVGAMTDDQLKALWMYPEGPKKIYMQRYLPEDVRSKWLELWNEVKAN